MVPPELSPELENQRLAELYSYNIMDTLPDEDFDGIVELASYICATPISHISFIDRNRSWHKARKGLTDQDLPRDLSFCTFTIFEGEVIIVEDATKDERFSHNPAVTSDPHIRFYAGFPITTDKGCSIGTLCVVDNQVRTLTDQQLRSMGILAKQVIKLLEERKRSDLLQQSTLLEQQRNSRLQALTNTQRSIMGILGHDTKGPLFYMNLLIRSMMGEPIVDEELRDNLQIINNQLDSTLILLDDLLDWSKTNHDSQATQKEPYALDSIVDTLFSPLQVMAAQKNVTLINEVATNLTGSHNEKIISFILRNLLVNAVKFTRDGTVRMTANRVNDKINICVADTGRGMTEEQVQKILSKESRSTPGTDNEQGSGLGYLLIHEFLQQTGGTLDIESAVGRGTTVKLLIPG